MIACTQQESLAKYLDHALEGFQKSDGLSVQQFQHGQSNPTYLLQVRHLTKPALTMQSKENTR